MVGNGDVRFNELLPSVAEELSEDESDSIDLLCVSAGICCYRGEHFNLPISARHFESSLFRRLISSCLLKTVCSAASNLPSVSSCTGMGTLFAVRCTIQMLSASPIDSNHFLARSADCFIWMAYSCECTSRLIAAHCA